jgi:hypothetical protein
MKFCNKCKNKKLEIDFSRSQYKKSNGRCKLCRKEDSKNYYLLNKENIHKSHNNYVGNNKETVSYYQKAYRDAHKEKMQKYDVEYRVKNKTEINIKDRKRKALNKEKINERQRNKFKIMPTLKLRKCISVQVSKILKQNGSNKINSSILKFLPYTIDELKYHIECLFEPWMTWKNYGKYSTRDWNDEDSSTWFWQLDHIRPQSDFPYSSMRDENFKIIWDLSNLRPLSAKQNIVDGSTKIRHICVGK